MVSVRARARALLQHQGGGVGEGGRGSAREAARGETARRGRARAHARATAQWARVGEAVRVRGVWDGSVRVSEDAAVRVANSKVVGTSGHDVGRGKGMYTVVLAERSLWSFTQGDGQSQTFPTNNNTVFSLVQIMCEN